MNLGIKPVTELGLFGHRLGMMVPCSLNLVSSWCSNQFGISEFIVIGKYRKQAYIGQKLLYNINIYSQVYVFSCQTKTVFFSPCIST